jgi:hypothetical protein
MPADRIIHSSRKTIAIEIRPDGQVWVRAPMHTPQAYIDLFLAEKSDWIQQKLQLIQQRRQPAGEDNSIPEQGLYYLGELFPLQPAPRARSAQIHGQSILVPTGTPAEIKTHFLRFYRREAQKILPPIVHLLAARHAFNPQKVRISSARTRWGSCSNKGTISLTWRLMMVPMPLIEYVILHELTHLKVRNHSKQFWNALQAILPDFAGRRRQLRVMEKQLNFL